MYQRNNCVITLKFSVNDQSRASRGVSSDRTLLGAPFIPTPPFAYTRRGECPAFAYKYHGYIYEYGFHSHWDP